MNGRIGRTIDDIIETGDEPMIDRRIAPGYSTIVDDVVDDSSPML